MSDEQKMTLKPSLRQTSPSSPDEIPEATCYEGGFLTTANASWRTVKPVVDNEKCIGCLECYLYCPDGCIFKKQLEKKLKVEIDYDFCKGCGICSKVCRKCAITMEKES